MDWNAAIEKNGQALKRILAALVAMAGLRGQFTFFPQEGAAHQGVAQAEKSKLSPAQTLPRHLHRAVLRLLRPAEAAARRLIIVAARGMVVTLPPARLRPTKKKPIPTILPKHLRNVGTGIVLPRGLRSALPGTVYFFPQKGGVGPEADASGKKVNCPPHCRPLTLPLLDSLRQPFRHRRRHVPQQSAPRILFFDAGRPAALPPPPSPDDPLDATRLGLRLQALGSALDDLPAQARRLARWRARRDAHRDAEGAQSRHRDAEAAQSRHRVHRFSPLKPGSPPGLPRRASRRRPFHEVHDILRVTHGLAFWAMERPDPRRDTS